MHHGNKLSDITLITKCAHFEIHISHHIEKNVKYLHEVSKILRYSNEFEAIIMTAVYGAVML